MEPFTLGDSIREWRFARGMTQEELAAKVGRPVSAISKWETGDRLPSVRNFALIVRALVVLPDEVMRALFQLVENDRRRVVVTGCRDLTDWRLVYTRLDALLDEHGSLWLAHGGCRVADMLADRWARRQDPDKVAVTIYRADWKQQGRAAGPIRNRVMLRDFQPDILLAFPGGAGTANCVATAKELGIPVEEVEA